MDGFIEVIAIPAVIHLSMNLLFVHQNFPGQYLHLARHLAAQPGNRVVAISQRQDGDLPNVTIRRYRPQRKTTPNVHHYLTSLEAGVLNAQAVARVALDLKKSGFIPDVMLGHNGWGEIWYLKEVFPQAPLIGYFEFFYQRHGADVGFDPAEPVRFDAGPRIRTRNAGNLLGLQAADWGQCPAQWQRSTYPTIYHPKLHLVHEGIDTDLVRPNPNATLRIPMIATTARGEGSHQEKGNNKTDTLTRPEDIPASVTGRKGRHEPSDPLPLEFKAGDEVLTYVARNLEPYRGFPSFMRSLPKILQTRPNAQVLIVGGDEVSYGTPLPQGENWKKKMLKELGDSLDTNRIHFLGKVPYPTFIQILQISRVHLYLTVPFVLSWSMLEAMAAECLIVGSRTAPVEEVIEEGENGLLVDFFNPEEIAEQVIETLSNPDAFISLRRNARQSIIERYDLKRICLPKQLKLIENVRGKA